MESKIVVIKCKYCNQKFKGIMDSAVHFCGSNIFKTKWVRRIGRNARGKIRKTWMDKIQEEANRETRRHKSIINSLHRRSNSTLLH